MIRTSCFLSVLAALALSGTAFGQIQNRTPGATPVTRPTVSPYVSLSGRRTPAVNYFSIVRPQREFRTSLRQLTDRVAFDEAQTQTEADAAATTGTTAPTVPGTGHVTSFQNFSHFYPTPAAAGTVQSIRSRRQ
jgi:hypothetical protein